MHAGVTWLAGIGRALFKFRMLFGIAVAFVALRWLSPQPLFGREYWLVHLIGSLFLLAGILLRAWGAGSAGGHTRSARIEAPALITCGPFAHVRNPIYSGTILIALGMTMLIGDPLAYLFAGLALTVLYLAIIPAEEEFLGKQFGEKYLEYKRAVPRLIPRLTPWKGRTECGFEWKAVRGEGYVVVALIVIYGALVLGKVPLV